MNILFVFLACSLYDVEYVRARSCGPASFVFETPLRVDFPKCVVVKARCEIPQDKPPP